MFFLSTDDFEAQIRTEQLEDIIGDNEGILDTTALKAVAEMESYLNQRYDVAQIWATTGAQRNPIIVMYLVDMVLYHIHSLINPRNVPELRMNRYDAAMAWLNKVAKGQISPNLPLSEDTADEIRWGSNPKLGHGY